MKTRTPTDTVSAIAVIACLSVTTLPAVAQETELPAPQDFTAIVAELSPAVVGITARSMPTPGMMPPEGMPMPGPFGQMPGPFGQAPGQPAPEREMVAGGSGFLISNDGYVVTNNHVVEGADEIEILLADGSTRAAELIGT
ncbi:trypsin-like peptidase domain-containing protein, partial [Loktanella sp. DJP18]|uniref:trypsin-like peptidase domain-containing protein n=1 Tax=Loktanella sp. DJP18 TaxID=3409788 RepID=UPI003BB6EED1